ncbi:MAG: hypothetical protein M3Y55_05990 [Pseudomonadota bacterium]|nr:hypothetical protein [Pseudomonadota bacterium]
MAAKKSIVSKVADTVSGLYDGAKSMVMGHKKPTNHAVTKKAPAKKVVAKKVTAKKTAGKKKASKPTVKARKT